MGLASLSLILGTGLAGLSSDSWAVRAECHELLVGCGPLGMAVAAAGLGHPDPEVRFRCTEAARGKRPRVVPTKWIEWESWPKNRVR